MVFTKHLREGVRRGIIRCSVRIWTRPHVKVGGRYRMDEGRIVVDSLVPIDIADVTDDVARESGFSSVKALLETAQHGSGNNIYLIRFHYLPPGGWDVSRRASDGLGARPRRAQPGASRATSQLLKFTGSVRRDRAVDRWMTEHSGELGAIARHWFEVMRGCGGDVRELLHDGHPTVCVDGAAFAYVNAFTAHVNVGFFRGAEIADPSSLLEGTGRFMRHVKLRPAEGVDASALRGLIDTAYADIKRRLELEADGAARRRT
jgi:hypothetical protein